MEQPLVHDGQETVEDARIGLEDFVREADVRVRQVAFDFPLEGVVLEGADLHRPEDFLGYGELGEQSLPIAGSVDRERHEAHHQGFALALRPDDEDVLPRQEAEQDPGDFLAPFVHDGGHFLP